jgi:hypothetical protein
VEIEASETSLARSGVGVSNLQLGCAGANLGGAVGGQQGAGVQWRDVVGGRQGTGKEARRRRAQPMARLRSAQAGATGGAGPLEVEDSRTRSKDSSRHLQIYCAISYFFYLHLMLHAYVQRFDVTVTMQKFLALFRYNRPSAAVAASRRASSSTRPHKIK